jgi:hypothetical protein
MLLLTPPVAPQAVPLPLTSCMKTLHAFKKRGLSFIFVQLHAILHTFVTLLIYQTCCMCSRKQIAGAPPVATKAAC